MSRETQSPKLYISFKKFQQDIFQDDRLIWGLHLKIHFCHLQDVNEIVFKTRDLLFIRKWGFWYELASMIWEIAKRMIFISKSAKIKLLNDIDSCCWYLISFPSPSNVFNIFSFSQRILFVVSICLSKEYLLKIFSFFSGEEFVDLVSASDALSLTQYKSFSMRIFRC